MIKEPAPRSLREMHNRATRYEVVAVIPPGQFRIGFTARPNKRTLMNMARERSDELLPYVGNDAPASYTRASGWRIGPDVQVKLSGRTERDVNLSQASA